jgi:hypothetical protein
MARADVDSTDIIGKLREQYQSKVSMQAMGNGNYCFNSKNHCYVMVGMSLWRARDAILQRRRPGDFSTLGLANADVVGFEGAAHSLIERDARRGVGN